MTASRPLWRVTFTAPESIVDALVDRLDELALSVSAFEADGDGTERAPTWRIELLLDAEPDLDEIGCVVADAGMLRPDLAVDIVPETDWLTATARQFPPVRAGRFVVHGSHARDQLPADAIPVEIDAGLAFGSGEHATTQGCLMAMSRVVRRPRRVLDLGCGSAVLAIAAAKLWPTARIVAADNDPVAVRVAAANVRINGVASRVRTLVSEGYATPKIGRAAPFDLILANILADPLIELAPALARHLAPGGHAVLSGLLDRQAEAVIAAHVRQGLLLVHRRDIGPWTTLLMRRP